MAITATIDIAVNLSFLNILIIAKRATGAVNAPKAPWKALNTTKLIIFVDNPQATEEIINPIKDMIRSFLQPILSEIQPDAGINSPRASR